LKTVTTRSALLSGTVLLSLTTPSSALPPPERNVILHGFDLISINNCSTSGGTAYYSGTGNTITCSTGITVSNTALTLGSGVTLTLPDSGTITSSAWTLGASSQLIIPEAGTTTNPALVFSNAGTNTGIIAPASGELEFVISGTKQLDYGVTNAANWTFGSTLIVGNAAILTSGLITINSNTQGIRFGAGTNNYLTGGSANGALQVGQANSGTPVAQTIQFQSGSGTNISGQNAIILGSLSTGTGTDGDIILQTGVKNGGSNATAATATTALTIKGETQNINVATALTVGSSTAATLSTGETAGTKISASGTAPGAGYAKFEWTAGTTGGSCKLISYAGTSPTPVTIVDNVGSGC
jgi:hypothetical protein